ncbi:ribonuclease HII [Peptostreptococcus sp.]
MLKGLDLNEISKLKTRGIKDLADKIPQDQYLDFIEIFSVDDRKSVQAICEKLKKSIARIEAEEERLDLLNHYENECYKNGAVFVAGLDEVGRGPLAGPVVAAVVVLKPNARIPGINDSKKLSEEKRESLYDTIINEAIDYGIGMADNNEIDEHNILNATYIAMKRALERLEVDVDCLLNDAVRIPGVDIPQLPIIKGDAKSISIAAASIVAKVTRDRMMVDYDKEYPGYGFASNKGYGTRDHYQGLEKFGRTKIHRNSFLKNLQG